MAEITEHRETRIVPYTADLMYAVVADVEAYPQFLPWVMALRVLSRDVADARETITAEMAVGYRALRERYTSKVVLDPAARTIDVAAIKGPFHTLENHWRFTPEGDQCRIEFSLRFAFSSPLLAMAAGPAFGRALAKMTEAFEARAAKLSANSP